MSSQPSIAGMDLAIEGLHNARDLGGHAGPHGITRHGAVVRSESPALLTEAGRQALRAHGITASLDLRSDEEVDEEPSPLAASNLYKRAPILDREAMLKVRDLSHSEDLMQFMLFERSAQLAGALAGLLELAAAGGVLIHCRAGKDRTGLVAALLLANVGVPPVDIADDHARSNLNLEPLFAHWQSIAKNEEEKALASMRRFAPTRESMLVTLDAVAARSGGVPQYLVEIGLSETQVAGLRRLLL